MRRPPVSREGIAYFVSMDVRWGDMDALGHVNNAAYLSYSETARLNFFADQFRDDPRHMNGHAPILAEISCTYHRQLKHPAELEVGVAIESIGRSSLIVRAPIFVVGEELAAAEVRAILAWFDYDTQTTMPVPERLRTYFAAQKTAKETS